MKSTIITRAIAIAIAITTHTSSPAADPSATEGDGPNPDRPLSDLPTRELPVPDLAPTFFPGLAAPVSGVASLSVVVSGRLSDTRHDLGGSLVLELPFDGFVSSRRKPRLGTRASPQKAKESSKDKTVGDVADEPDREVAVERKRRSKGRRRQASWTPPRIRPDDARNAVAASRRVRRTHATLDDLDGLASRARYASLLPTLRLRATRLVDESVSLSPTSYDAERTTTRGGASLWLEARATWNLDRVVFASEEVRVTQLQLDYVGKQRKASEQVVAQLFAWQRAVYAAHDPTLAIDECVQAWLEVQERAAHLDLVTGGWFARWSRGKAGATPDCVHAFASDE